MISKQEKDKSNLREPNEPGDVGGAGGSPTELENSAATDVEDQTIMDAAENASDAMPEELPGELDKLRAELDDARERNLRAQADFDNYRKRVSREMQESQRYAAVNIIRDLLPVVDNIQRALAAAETAGEGGSLLQGVRMVAQQMMDVLSQHGCQRIAAAGEVFDADLHEAVGSQPSAEVSPGTVLIVTEEGYRVADRVVRPSKVIVAKEIEK